MLPFPFDAVEQFFKDIFKQIIDSIRGIVADITKTLAPLFNEVKNFITSGISTIQSSVFGQLEFFKDQIIGALVGVPQQVASLLGGIKGAVEPIFAQLDATFRGLFTTISNSLNNIIIPFLQSIPVSINNIVSSASSQIRDFIDANTNLLTGLVGQAINQIQNFPGIIAGQLEQVSNFLQSQINNIPLALKPILDSIDGFGRSTNKVIQDTQIGFLQFQSNIQNQLNSLSSGFGAALQQTFENAVNLATGLKTSLIDPILEQINTLPQTIKNIMRPTGSITPEAAKGELDQAGVIMVGAYAGVNAVGVIAEIASAGQIDQITEGILNTMDDVGLSIFAKDFVTFDYEVGVKPALTRETLRRFVPNIPGAGDLVNMVVKEAFVESLRTPAPEIFAKFMAEQGFDKFWSDTFWTAHWQPIDLGSITQMFHRGIIDEADFIRRLIILDFRPDDTEIVKQLTFKLPNRIEARLMARFGILTDSQLDEIIRAEGVREDFVQPLRTMMQDFNLTNIFTRTESAAISSYEDGLINTSQLGQILTQIKRPPNVINADIELGNFKRLMDFKSKQLKSITKALKRGLIDAARATTEMQAIGTDTEVIDFTIANALFELNLGTSDEVKKAAPKLTPSQIVKSLKENLITIDDALNALDAKGYTPEESLILLQLGGVETA